jgi:hypothetical protein
MLGSLGIFLLYRLECNAKVHLSLLNNKMQHPVLLKLEVLLIDERGERSAMMRKER